MPRNPLNPRLPPKTSTGRRQRKRYKNEGSRPEHGELMRRLWQDPVFLEKMAARTARRVEDQKRNPLKYSRAGIPDGMTKKMVKPLWDRAYQLADKFIQIMQDTGQLPEDETEEVEVASNGNIVTSVEGIALSTVSVPTTDAGMAKAALREAFVLAVGPSDQKIKIQALNTILNFTKSKPEAKSKVTLEKAEDFLAEVANDLKSD